MQAESTSLQTDLFALKSTSETLFVVTSALQNDSERLSQSTATLLNTSVHLTNVTTELSRNAFTLTDAIRDLSWNTSLLSQNVAGASASITSLQEKTNDSVNLLTDTVNGLNITVNNEQVLAAVEFHMPCNSWASSIATVKASDPKMHLPTQHSASSWAWYYGKGQSVLSPPLIPFPDVNCTQNHTWVVPPINISWNINETALATWKFYRFNILELARTRFLPQGPFAGGEGVYAVETSMNTSQCARMENGGYPEAYHDVYLREDGRMICAVTILHASGGCSEERSEVIDLPSKFCEQRRTFTCPSLMDGAATCTQELPSCKATHYITPIYPTVYNQQRKVSLSYLNC